jgi:hypothetical protein
MGYVVEVPKTKRKLSQEQIEDIVKRYQPRLNGTELAAEFGISLSHLIHVVERYNKAKIAKEPVKRGRKKKTA